MPLSYHSVRNAQSPKANEKDGGMASEARLDQGTSRRAKPPPGAMLGFQCLQWLAALSKVLQPFLLLLGGDQNLREVEESTQRL